MKSFSALILVCAFVCASAQYGVKGGSSGASKTVRFFPRLSAASVGAKKEQLQYAEVDEVVSGPAVVNVGGGTSGSSSYSSESSGFSSGSSDFSSENTGFTSGSSGFVQPAVQEEKVVTVVQERPQTVLVPSSGSSGTVSTVKTVSVAAPAPVPVEPATYEYYTPAVQTTFQRVVPSSYPQYVPALPAYQTEKFVQSSYTPGYQTYHSSVAPLSKVYQQSGLYVEKQPAQFVHTYPGYTQTVHYAHQQQPQPQVSGFASKSFSSESYSNQQQPQPQVPLSAFASKSYTAESHGNQQPQPVVSSFASKSVTSESYGNQQQPQPQVPLSAFASKSFSSESYGNQQQPQPQVSSFASKSVTSESYAPVVSGKQVYRQVTSVAPAAPLLPVPQPQVTFVAPSAQVSGKVSTGYTSYSQQQRYAPQVYAEKQTETVQTTDW